MMPDGYAVETIDVPDLLEVGGLAVRENGNVLASTRGGEVWEYEPNLGEWTRFAHGLHQALGLWIDDETDDVYTAHKPELTRLVDIDGDGAAELYETVADDWGRTGDYHEFVYGPVQDSEGNFYVNVGLGGEGHLGEPVGDPNDLPPWAMVHGADYHGWVVKITPDGELTPYAPGIRSPAGIGINADDEVFYTDNEGDWIPTCQLCLVEEDNFYGHPAGLRDHPDYEDEDLNDVDDWGETYEYYEEMRTLPALWFPYFEAASTGGVTFDEQGNFGPFEGQLFIGDQLYPKVVRVALEEVDGAYQGAMFNFVEGLQCGLISEAFSPDGSGLWVGQTSRGWASAGQETSYGLQRIDYDGTTTPFEMHSVHIQPSGFEIEFTKPADIGDAGDAGNYAIRHWGYDNSASYGSPEEDETQVTDIDASVLDDGDRVRLDLPEIYVTPEGEAGLLSGTRVYEITLDGVESADGDELVNNQAWYTVNNVPE